MVSDDEVHPGAARALGSGKGTSPCIYADHQANAGRSGTLDYVPAQVITFADSMRHMKLSSAAAQLDRRFQDYHRSGAIDVVVAVNEDSLFALDRCIQTFDRGLHAGHQIRRVEMVNRGEQETSCGFRRVNLSEKKESGNNRVKIRVASFGLLPKQLQRGNFCC